MALVHATPDYKTAQDLLVTALEGGSNYWYYLPDISMVPKTYSAPHDLTYTEPGSQLDPVSIRIAKAVWAGASVPVQDVEDHTPLGVIAKDGLLAALDRMIAGNGKRAAGRIIAEDYDAGDADLWLQFAVMGKAVYG
jgi:hypothetical protein